MLYGLIHNGYADTSGMVYLIPSCAAEVGAATAFYYSKAKSENLYRYGEEFINEFAEKYGVDNAVLLGQAFFNTVTSLK